MADVKVMVQDTKDYVNELKLEMKRVLREVLAAVDLQPVDTRGERVSKAAISFSPGEKGLVMVG